MGRAPRIDARVGKGGMKTVKREMKREKDAHPCRYYESERLELHRQSDAVVDLSDEG